MVAIVRVETLSSQSLLRVHESESRANSEAGVVICQT